MSGYAFLTKPVFPSNEQIGFAIIVAGAVLGIIGAIMNALLQSHHAFTVWLISNALLALWAAGYVMKKWNSQIGGVALVILYSLYEITSLWGFLHT